MGSPGSLYAGYVQPAKWLFILRVAVIVALAASALLYVDYTSMSPAFCSAGTGCAAVRQSGYGYVPITSLSTYVPVPSFGLFGFGVLLALSLLPMLGGVIAGVAALGGVTALVLLYLQAIKVGEFCTLCVIVDVFAIIAAIAGIGFWRSIRSPDPGESFDWLLRRWAWPWLAALAVFAPVIWPAVRPNPPVPAGVMAHYKPGKINVVEFADYECPFCRLLHAQLKRVIASFPGQVNFVRLNMPLLSHPQAKDAARTAVCVIRLDPTKTEAIADLLFEAEDLSPKANREAAAKTQVDLAKYDECIASGAADKQIAKESQILRDAGFEGLPTTYVGARRIVGALPEAEFYAAFQLAASGGGNVGIPPGAYLLLVVLLAGLVFAFGRTREAHEQSIRQRKA